MKSCPLTPPDAGDARNRTRFTTWSVDSGSTCPVGSSGASPKTPAVIAVRAADDDEHRVLATMHVAYGFERVLNALSAEPGDMDDVTEAWTVENESSGGFGAVLLGERGDLIASIDLPDRGHDITVSRQAGRGARDVQRFLRR